MIPAFPQFKHLELQDFGEVSGYISQYRHYSDWNIISLWSWNSGQTCRVSLLHKNLVIEMAHYVSQKKVYAFLGPHRTQQTINKLAQHAFEQTGSAKIHLVPESALTPALLAHPESKIRLDRDNFDYIYSLNLLRDMKGAKYRGKKNFVNRFVRSYEKSCSVLELDISNPQHISSIQEMFQRWETTQKKSRSETQFELNAVMTLIKHAAHFPDLITIGLYVKDVLVGISINSRTDDDYATNHHELADVSYIGSFQYLRLKTAEVLYQKGYRHINFEQDLGVPGLRRAKKSWRPVKYMRKATITVLQK